jgi:hypothetical protein
MRDTDWNQQNDFKKHGWTVENGGRATLPQVLVVEYAEFAGEEL